MLWQPGVTLDQVEKEVILKALSFYHGNKTVTARALGIAIRTLDNKLEKYNGNINVRPETGVHVQPAQKPTQEPALPVRKR